MTGGRALDLGLRGAASRRNLACGAFRSGRRDELEHAEIFQRGDALSPLKPVSLSGNHSAQVVRARDGGDAAQEKDVLLGKIVVVRGDFPDPRFRRHVGEGREF